MGVSYCTREDVKSALDIKDSARANRQIDRLIRSSSEAIDGDMNRVFYPTVASRYKDWPNTQYARPWRLWLDEDEVITVTSLISGGVTLTSNQFNLEPVNQGPPFTWIEINLAAGKFFSAGPNTFQRSIEIAGLFGYRNDEEAAGSLAAAISTTSVTTCNVTDSAAIGVGQIIRIDNERLIVTEKSSLTTGQTLQTPVGASVAETLIAVTNGAAFALDEALLLDAERMQIVDIAGNSLIVRRAVDGSVLAAHAGSTIYAPRTLTVERGALGTTAATHLNAAPVARFVPPRLIRALSVAETLNSLEQETSAYVRTVGAGETARNASGAGLRDIRDRAIQAHARQARTRAV